MRLELDGGEGIWRHDRLASSVRLCQPSSMAGPTITDWLQGVGTAAALALSMGSLCWQWLARAERDRRRIQLVAEDQGNDFWLATLTVADLEPHAQAYVNIRIPKDALFQDKLAYLSDFRRRHEDDGDRNIDGSLDFNTYQPHGGRRAIEMNLALSIDRADGLARGVADFVIWSPRPIVPLEVRVHLYGRLLPLLRRNLSLSAVRKRAPTVDLLASRSAHNPP
ncbi:hypothetical protein [Phenylobacterium sp.]|uniref:hypothetical protein n=1 Tax=Phenylobacterium sp. TaxID=1871053 RepID=UPI00281286DE|nr:hypothetical protein [Phenylobacterium sp.]